MPATFAQCQICSCSVSGSILWGHFEYKTEDGAVHVDREIGWCENCRAPKAVERIEKPLETFRRYEAELEKLETIRLKLKHQWVRFFGGQVRHGFEYQQRVTQEQLRRLKWRLQRVSKPRCLICASIKITPWDFEQRNVGAKSEGRFEHGGCPGVFIVKTPDMLLSMRLKNYFFDAEGMPLSSHPSENGGGS